MLGSQQVHAAWRRALVAALAAIALATIGFGDTVAAQENVTAPVVAPAAPAQPVVVPAVPAQPVVALPVAGQPAPVGQTDPSAAGRFKMGDMAEALFAAFILAIVLESALALIFNWRPFVRLVDGRGVRSIISLILALIVVRAVDLDLIQEIKAAMPPPPGGPVPVVARVAPTATLIGYLITAMIVAGGSAGVNNLLVALGFRRVTRIEEVAPRPAPDRAWLAVRLKRSNPHEAAVVRVMLSSDGQPFKLVGMISGRTSPQGFLRWFLQDRTRFPTIAGYSVPGDHDYTIRLERDDVALGPVPSEEWGPFLVAKGAVIDIELTL